MTFNKALAWFANVWAGLMEEMPRRRPRQLARLSEYKSVCGCSSTALSNASAADPASRATA
jgi:hypothetical protein